MQSIEQIKSILADALSLGERAACLSADSKLLGNLPELDSMAIVSLISMIEEYFGIAFDDDDMSASVFQTVGSLSALVDRKLMQ